MDTPSSLLVQIAAYAYIVLVAVFCYFVGQGLRAASARRYLMLGAERAQKGEFKEAREAVLVAARQDPSLKSNADVQALYEIIVARGGGDSVYEIRRIASVLPSIPKAKWERFIEHPGFKVGVFLLVALLILGKLLS